MDPREQTKVPWTKENRRKYTYSKVPIGTRTGRNYLISAMRIDMREYIKNGCQGFPMNGKVQAIYTS